MPFISLVLLSGCGFVWTSAWAAVRLNQLGQKNMRELLLAHLRMDPKLCIRFFLEVISLAGILSPPPQKPKQANKQAIHHGAGIC
jgi:hypothetical protein